MSQEISKPKSPALGYTQVEALLVLLTACANFKFRLQQPRDSQLLVLGAVEGRKHSKTVPKPRPSLGRDRLPRPGALERIQHRAWTAPQHSFGHTHTHAQRHARTHEHVGGEMSENKATSQQAYVRSRVCTQTQQDHTHTHCLSLILAASLSLSLSVPLLLADPCCLCCHAHTGMHAACRCFSDSLILIHAVLYQKQRSAWNRL